MVRLCFSDFGARTYFFEVTLGSLRATPRWKPSAKFPPLPPREAEAAALQRAQQMRPDVRSWSRESISLRETGDGEWFYVVTFTPSDEAVIGVPYFLDVPVLMDGRTVPATLHPTSKLR
jgi:hypothetical protein